MCVCVRVVVFGGGVVVVVEEEKEGLYEKEREKWRVEKQLFIYP